MQHAKEAHMNSSVEMNQIVHLPFLPHTRHGKSSQHSTKKRTQVGPISQYLNPSGLQRFLRSLMGGLLSSHLWWLTPMVCCLYQSLSCILTVFAITSSLTDSNCICSTICCAI